MIERILDKIRQVNRRRARAGTARYVLGRPLSEHKLRAFEAAHGIALPDDYRAFVATVGNGNREPGARQIFPLGGRAQLMWHHSRATALELARPWPTCARGACATRCAAASS